jgi:hypothetical protein
MNNKPKVLFIRIPKTGSTSIRTALNIPNIHGHQTLAFFQEHGIEYDYSFTFVRNTYTRLVSWYRHEYGYNIKGFRKWVQSGCTIDWDDDWIASWQDNNPMDQMLYIKNKEGEIDIDFIGFFENIKEDYLEVCNQLDMNPPPQLTKIIPRPFHSQFNKTEFRYDAKEYYDDETRKKVDELFKEEIDYFKFKFFDNE